MCVCTHIYVCIHRHNTHTHIYLLLLPSVTSHMLTVSPEDTVHFGHRIQKIWDVSQLKASFMPSSFHRTRGAVQAAKGVEKSIVLLIFGTYEPQQWPAWKDSPRGVIVVLLSVWEPPAIKLDLSPTHLEVNRAWYYKPSQLPGPSEIMDFKREISDETLVGQHNS